MSAETTTEDRAVEQAVLDQQAQATAAAEAEAARRDEAIRQARARELEESPARRTGPQPETGGMEIDL